MSATAVTASSVQVADSDTSRFVHNTTGIRSQKFSVTADTYAPEPGGSVIFTVEVAANGNDRNTPFSAISSNVDDCDRNFDTQIEVGEFVRYTCTATDVQPPFLATFNVVNDFVSTGVEIQTRGTAALDLELSINGRADNLLSSEVYISKYAQDNHHEIIVHNSGAVDLSNIQLNAHRDECTVQIPLLRPREAQRIDCGAIEIEQGEFERINATASTTAPDGSLVSSNLEQRTVFVENNSFNFKYYLDLLETAPVQPGEQTPAMLRIENKGYYSVSGISSIGDTYSSMGDCNDVFISILQDNFTLPAGERISAPCNFVMPQSTENYVFPTVYYNVADLPGITKRGYSGYYPIHPQKEAAPANAEMVSYSSVQTDASALPDPQIDRSRVLQLLTNGEFESIANNLPVGWTSSCQGTAIPSSTVNGNAMLFGRDSCISYQLSSNDLAQLAGNFFKLSCEVPYKVSGYTSMNITLDGVNTETYVDYYSHDYLEIKGEAPQDLSEASITLYSYVDAVYDTCQLIVTKSGVSDAALDVKIGPEGHELIAGRGPVNYPLTVTNKGTVDLNDIQVFSDELNCEAAFAALPIGTSKSVLCRTDDEIQYWDERKSYLATASALTATGEVVTDSDMSGHTLDGEYATNFKVLMNSRDVAELKGNLTSVPAVPAGSDIEFTVEWMVSYGDKNWISGSLPGCSKVFEPLVPGDFVSFTCRLDNIQQETDIKFETSKRAQVFTIPVN